MKEDKEKKWLVTGQWKRVIWISRLGRSGGSYYQELPVTSWAWTQVARWSRVANNDSRGGLSNLITWHPPCKSRLCVNASGLGIFCHLNRIGNSERNPWKPLLCPILPLNQELPSLCGFAFSLVSLLNDDMPFVLVLHPLCGPQCCLAFLLPSRSAIFACDIARYENTPIKLNRMCKPVSSKYKCMVIQPCIIHQNL